MHEFGLCEGVVDAVRQRARGRRVTGVRVRFGVRHAVDEESLAQAFSMLTEGTEAAGAAVELVTVPATIEKGRIRERKGKKEKIGKKKKKKERPKKKKRKKKKKKKKS